MYDNKFVASDHREFTLPTLYMKINLLQVMLCVYELNGPNMHENISHHFILFTNNSVVIYVDPSNTSE